MIGQFGHADSFEQAPPGLPGVITRACVSCLLLEAFGVEVMVYLFNIRITRW